MKETKLPKEKAKAKFMSFLATQAIHEVKIHPTPFIRVSEDNVFSDLANELLEEYHDLYHEHFTEEELEKLRTVKIKWMRRKAYKQMGVYYKNRNTVYVSKWYKEQADLNDQIVLDSIKGLLHHEFGHIKWFDHYKAFTQFTEDCHFTEIMDEYDNAIGLALVLWVKGDNAEWGEIDTFMRGDEKRARIKYYDIANDKHSYFSFPIEYLEVLLELRQDGDI